MKQVSDQGMLLMANLMKDFITNLVDDEVQSSHD